MSDDFTPAAAGVVLPDGAVESGGEAPSSSPDLPSGGGEFDVEALETYCCEAVPQVLGHGFAERAEAAHAYAQEFETQHPELADAFGRAAAKDPELWALGVRYLFEQGESFNQPGETHMEEAPRRPGHQGLQDRIDELMDKHPPGTPGYNSPRVQREIQRLHEKLHGTEPIVGAWGEDGQRVL